MSTQTNRSSQRGSGGEDERTTRMLIAAAVDGGDARATMLATMAGVDAAWAAIRAGDLGSGVRVRAEHADPAALMAATGRARMRFVIPGDAEWPTALDDLAAVPPGAHGRGGVPVGLWVRGPLDLADSVRRAVAVVGSRACSPYGERVAHDLAQDLAELGTTVVSGLALGVDVAAHRGAVSVDGATIAVLASGADVAYPRANERMYDRLAQHELIVSEVAPGASPTRVGFLARNRLIAALSQGTVLVEAGVRSGARNTLNWATECSRVAMAVPGSIESSLSLGPHVAIRDQQAVLVTGARDVHELIAPMGEGAQGTRRGESRVTDDLDPTALAVYEALPGRGRRTVGELALAGRVAVPACLAALGRLETLGLVDTQDGGWRLAR